MSERLADGTIQISYVRKYHKGEGRRLNLTDEQIAAVIENILLGEKGQTRREFQAATGISPYTYRSIAYGHLKNAKDRARVDRIAAKYGHKINWQ